MDSISDDFDFIPTTNSSLASLFDSSNTEPSGSSLLYTPPKQPRDISQSETTLKTESNVVAAKAVSAWKLVANKYMPLGTLGIAVIGSHSKNIYELILYKGKTNVILRVNVDNTLKITVKPDNFITFYDKLNINWLVKFSQQGDLRTITSEIEKLDGHVISETIEHASEKTTETVKDSDENKSKAAEILSRISKMGQSMLPNVTAKEESVHIKSEEDTQLGTITENSLPNRNTIFETRPLVTTAVQLTNKYNNPHHIPYSLMHQSTVSDPLNLLFMNSQTNHNEVRLNLGHLDEKLNQILKELQKSKIENQTSEDASVLRKKIKVLELKQENLIKELSSCQQQIHSKDMETTARSLQSSQNNEELESLRERVNQLSTTLESQEHEIKKYKEIIDENNNKIEDLVSRNSKLEELLSEVESKLTVTEQKNKSVGNNEHFVELLKNSMNNMFVDIMNGFQEDQSYSSSQIQAIVAKNIKVITKQLIKEFEVTK